MQDRNMLLNQTDRDDYAKEYLKRLMINMAKSGAELQAAYKYKDLYGEWGMICARFLNPFLWVFPFIAAILLIISFKRQQLFGNMQKCLIAVMIIDVCFAMLTGLKDAVFNVMNWNYGFVEYKVCLFLQLFIRIQTTMHATSLWIKSLLLLHRVMMFLFPFKFRQFRFRLILIPFFSFHFLLVISFCAFVFTIPFKGIPTVQAYVKGMPFQRIDACVVNPDNSFFKETIHRIEQIISRFLQLVYFTSLPILINFICTFLFIVLVKREIKKFSFLTIAGSSKILKNVKYFILIKVHILLGISFILQESPVYISFFVLFFSEDQGTVKFAHSVIISYMIQTFAIGKPIDLLIYASLSQKVKSELLRIIRCKNI